MYGKSYVVADCNPLIKKNVTGSDSLVDVAQGFGRNTYIGVPLVLCLNVVSTLYCFAYFSLMLCNLVN